jgi:hypothetical protein
MDVLTDIGLCPSEHKGLIKAQYEILGCGSERVGREG